MIIGKYACEEDEMVEVTLTYSVKFVVTQTTKSIALEVPDFIKTESVKVESVPQPMHDFKI